MSTPDHLEDLETPAAVVDMARMRANVERAASYAREHGLRLRPHTKTHKSAELARMQVEAGASGVTVAIPREAEVMSREVDDILVAYPPLGAWRIERLLDLPPDVRLTVALDSADALRPLAAAAQRRGLEIGVLIEIDVGLGRTGVGTPPEAVELARLASDLDGVTYRGLMFYPGHIRSPVERQTGALRELSERLGAFRAALGDAGLEPEVVSGGSTPTFPRSHEVEGLTEIRPGTNIFNDRTTALLGACRWEDCAYSILATVVSASVPGQVVVDAGSKALAKEELRADPGDSDGPPGYGCLLGRPDVVVVSLSEEHGVLDLSRTDWKPRVGDRIRLVPNHVCVSVNLAPELWGVDGDLVETRWPVEASRRADGR